ncbi:purine-nucleoside phosphorylase [Azospirillum formosense]|uniref:Purine nucleoside phosphorylase n=1 Tax=Azospirillum formosense TaxID=861533 RepID=A0ABX2L1K7_9PROT|nr:purine-nucleoside phosphorylase [Azospirillum formosense]MBY3752648.1 purine-nucleoside phosphorylase [Azospirillum formosense]NUB22763.1 purine-nucleoside phosphorylase [Azospirillum formosense]
MTAARAAAEILHRVPGFRPRVGIVLGSGLGGVADRIEGATVMPYGDLPGFPLPSVEGHMGRLVLGRLGGQPVACMQGRVHAYEGNGFDALKTAVRALKLAGCDTLVLTCAAGSLRVEVGPGRLMAISDHINMLGANPLTGPNEDSFGPRFPSMTDAWDPTLRALMRRRALELNIDLVEGVYAAYPGPSFETPAEVRMLKVLGADAVGMSTVPECIVARHCGLRVVGCAVITNLGVGLGDGPVDHDQTLRAASAAAFDLERLLTGFLDGLNIDEGRRS